MELKHIVVLSDEEYNEYQNSKKLVDMNTSNDRYQIEAMHTERLACMEKELIYTKNELEDVTDRYEKLLELLNMRNIPIDKTYSIGTIVYTKCDSHPCCRQCEFAKINIGEIIDYDGDTKKYTVQSLQDSEFECYFTEDQIYR